MGQVSAKLRRVDGSYSHWCPACGEMHKLPDGWAFDGNLDQPTFTPSFRHSGKQRVIVNGEWTGHWVRGADNQPLPWCCHYILTAGQLSFCGDCTHSMAGQVVPLPDLPAHLRDSEQGADDQCGAGNQSRPS